MPLRPSQVETLRLVDEKPLNAVTGGGTGATIDCAYINWRTAEALERHGLITITREIDGDCLKAWECRLTQLGHEALEGSNG
jgi:hypothetical protein